MVLQDRSSFLQVPYPDTAPVTSVAPEEFLCTSTHVGQFYGEVFIIQAAHHYRASSLYDCLLPGFNSSNYGLREFRVGITSYTDQRTAAAMLRDQPWRKILQCASGYATRTLELSKQMSLASDAELQRLSVEATRQLITDCDRQFSASQVRLKTVKRVTAYTVSPLDVFLC
jgi:hypothetical protein